MVRPNELNLNSSIFQPSFNLTSKVQRGMLKVRKTVHVDNEFFEAGILHDEMASIYESIEDEDVFGLISPIVSLSEKTMPSVMLKKFVSEFLSKGGKMIRLRVDNLQSSTLRLMIEINNEDDNSALIAFLTRDSLNKEFKSVGILMELLVVEESDNMYFPPSMPTADASSK